MVVGIGDNCVDRYPAPIRRTFAGGNVFNVVAQCLQHHHAAVYCGSVGDDADGTLIRRELARLGGSLRFLRVVPGGRTGVSRIAPGPDGEPRIIGEDYGVSGEPPLEPDLRELLSRERPLVHLSTNGHALRVARFVEGIDARLSCDFGYHLPDASPGATKELLGRLTYAFISVGDETTDAEARPLSETVARNGPRRVVVSRGRRGVVVWWDDTVAEAPAHPLSGPAVDTLGAGDALIAGMLASVDDGGTLAQHLDQGLRWARDACLHPGAF